MVYKFKVLYRPKEELNKITGKVSSIKKKGGDIFRNFNAMKNKIKFHDRSQASILSSDGNINWKKVKEFREQTKYGKS